VLTHDRAGFTATLDDPRSRFGRRQLAVFAAMTSLPIGTLTYGTPEQTADLAPRSQAAEGRDGWVAKVPVAYSFKGYDSGQRSFEATFTVVRGPDGWRLAGSDAGGADQQQPWDLPQMRVVSDSRVLVAGNVDKDTLRAYLHLGRDAVDAVDAVWTAAWPRHLVLVAPLTEAQARAQLSRAEGELGQVAAVTDGPVSATTGVAGADRIIVNPAAFARLTPPGRQVVVTHEATHVAVRASTSGQVPTWLSEGFADYVGYRSVDLPREDIAEALLAQVRAGKVPASLPQADDFDPARSTIAPSYNAAWLAACLVADRWGKARLVELYRAAAGPNTAEHRARAQVEARLDAAFARVLGTTRSAFTAQWRSFVLSLAH
jgi:hypothetical protein